MCDLILVRGRRDPEVIGLRDEAVVLDYADALVAAHAEPIRTILPGEIFAGPILQALPNKCEARNGDENVSRSRIVAVEELADEGVWRPGGKALSRWNR
jgi:hypothetical protein